MQLNFTSLKKNQKIAIHILVWAVLISLPYIFALQAEDGGPRSQITGKRLLLNSSMNIFWALTFYLNSYVLIPKILYQSRLLLFVFANLGLLAGVLFMNQWMYNLLIYEHPYFFFKAITYNGLPFLFFVLISIAFKTVFDRIKMDRIAKERQSENLKTELSFLRSQISPHFLFNVLNNIVALVRLKSDELEPTILKLSSLMQYMLYETDDEKVLLKSEADYLQSYIDLQKLRFGDWLKLNVDLGLKEDWHTIEPMLLISFVENAFKHGTGMIENPIIDISLQAVNNELAFIVKNKFIDDDQAKDQVSSIGLINVKRRLQLLYGKNHDLNIDSTDQWFIVTLKLAFEP